MTTLVSARRDPCPNPGVKGAHAGASEGERFCRDVLLGLSADQKRLSPKYFYDRPGSLLFDRICELPEYYVTRVELSIMRAHVEALVSDWGDRVRVVEPGAGSGLKTRLLLEALGERCVEYVPLDVAREHLMATAVRLRAEMPWLTVSPVVADFAAELPGLSPLTKEQARTVVYFPGSTIGNFDPLEAGRLLVRFGRLAGDRGTVMIGVDLKKDPAVLHAAYNDSRGVTAAFNKNLLLRINRELQADFDVDAFAHYAFYEPTKGRIEMHLVSLARQQVRVGTRLFDFEEGESIHTECSYKYDLTQIGRLASSASLRVAREVVDEERRFAVVVMRN